VCYTFLLLNVLVFFQKNHQSIHSCYGTEGSCFACRGLYLRSWDLLHLSLFLSQGSAVCLGERTERHDHEGPITDRHVCGLCRLLRSRLCIHSVPYRFLLPQEYRHNLETTSRQHCQFHDTQPGGCTNPGCPQSWRLHFVRWGPILVAPQNGTGFISPFWRLEFWNGS